VFLFPVAPAPPRVTRSGSQLTLPTSPIPMQSPPWPVVSLEADGRGSPHTIDVATVGRAHNLVVFCSSDSPDSTFTPLCDADYHAVPVPDDGEPRPHILLIDPPRSSSPHPGAATTRYTFHSSNVVHLCHARFASLLGFGPTTPHLFYWLPYGSGSSSAIPRCIPDGFFHDSRFVLNRLELRIVHRWICRSHIMNGCVVHILQDTPTFSGVLHHLDPHICVTDLCPHTVPTF